MYSINVKAYAKINLGLEVLYKRQDGYHELNTIFICIDLFDELIIEKDDKLSIHCQPELNIAMQDNLVWKAAKRLQNYYRCNHFGAKIKLIKNIPTGAGLGGGSSDAASTLIALSKLWNLPSTNSELIDIASEIGSDIPYFINKGIALAKGRGEILIPFNASLNYYVLIVYPNIQISTKWAYSSLDVNTNSKQATNYIEIMNDSNFNLKILNQNFINDFEKTVFNKYPEIKKIKENMYELNSVFSLLSGSGSAVYGLFNTIEEAKRAAEYFINYQTFICKLIDK